MNILVLPIGIVVHISINLKYSLRVVVNGNRFLPSESQDHTCPDLTVGSRVPWSANLGMCRVHMLYVQV